MLAFLQPILNFFGGPVVKGVVDAYKAKLDAGNTQERIAADLAGRELAVQQKEVEVQAQLKIAQIGHWYTVENLAGYIVVFYIGKVMVYDAALGLGSTDAVRGDVGTWAALIIVFFFGKRGIENVARILRR